MSRRGDSRLDHLGDVVAGLVDGHLADAARERALAHLTHCSACRSEVAALRQLRRRLLGLGEGAVMLPSGLAARLLAVPPGSTGPTRPGGPYAPPTRPRAAARPGRRSVRRSPRLSLLGAALVVGVGAVLLAGSATGTPDRPPIPRSRPEPASDLQQVDVGGFVTDFPAVDLVVVSPTATAR